MLHRLAMISIAAASLVVGMAPAAAQSNGFVLSTDSGGCYLEFSDVPLGAESRALVKGRGCAEGGFGNLAAWRTDGSAYILEYANSAGALMPLARLEPNGRGGYEGYYGDGDPISMAPADQFGSSPAPSQAPAPNLGAARACTADIATGSCASDFDVTPPPYSDTFPSIETKVRQNVRARPDMNAPKMGTFEARTCMDVRQCVEVGGGEWWCEVPFADRTGWMIQQDPSTVFMQNGCG